MARKKREEEHENHERWLVSYADFITLLFAFFVVMYAISQVNQGKYRVLSDSLVSAFQRMPSSINPVVLDPQQGGSNPGKLVNIRPAQPDPRDAAKAQKMKEIATGVQGAMQTLIQEGQVKITQSKRGIAVEMNASILFEPARADLQGESVSVLTAVAQILASTDNLIQVEGHTDNVPINFSSSYPSNWELSAARAGSVVRLFQSLGVAPQRMVAIGYADNRPVDTNDSVDGRSHNRRVTVQILADNRDEVAVLPSGQ